MEHLHAFYIQQDRATQLMTGEDYETWNGGNDYAFNFIANNINVTIL